LGKHVSAEQCCKRNGNKPFHHHLDFCWLAKIPARDEDRDKKKRKKCLQFIYDRLYVSENQGIDRPEETAELMGRFIAEYRLQFICCNIQMTVYEVIRS
jgi:hypothetical protein